MNVDFLKNDKNHLCLELKIILLQQNEDYLDYNKNEEETFLEMILNK